MKLILEKIESKFSNKQQRIHSKVQKILGWQVSVALVSMQGFRGTSQEEIKFISELISDYQPLSIRHYSESPKSLIIEGVFAGAYPVYIYPQYEVCQPDSFRNTKGKNWSVDVVLKLYTKIGDEPHQIAIIGYEYDGHISHYVQDEVRKAYVRDAGILQAEGFNPVRISPEGWRSNPDHYKKSLSKFFNRKALEIGAIQAKTIRHAVASNADESEVLYTLVVTCPLCNGKCRFGRDECPVCNGMGSIIESKVSFLDLMQYENNRCPDCGYGAVGCKTCHEKGVLSRQQMLELT